MLTSFFSTNTKIGFFSQFCTHFFAEGFKIVDLGGIVFHIHIPTRSDAHRKKSGWVTVTPPATGELQHLAEVRGQNKGFQYNNTLQ